MAAHFGVAWKALVPVGGEPMVTHVVRTLSQVAEIGKIVVLSQDTEALSAAVAVGAFR
jgi:GTP:adenosylcobinamide-phosphate guanylyltransferase